MSYIAYTSNMSNKGDIRDSPELAMGSRGTFLELRKNSRNSPESTIGIGRAQ